MRYYIVSDTHGFYSRLHGALTKAGFFEDAGPRKLVMLGDLFDRGQEAEELQSFVLDLMERDEVILVRGNHEDLFVELATTDGGVPYRHHRQNGTYRTALQLTGYTETEAFVHCADFAEAARKTPLYRQIIPAMVDYFETERYIFVHGWIPCTVEDGVFSSCPEWRNASAREWDSARWYNGMDAVCGAPTDKIVVCGHWHASYGHARYEGICSEFGEGADFSPYYADGIIAVDGCTAYSGRVNVVVIED